jgi:mono/diheme cytochrome c family protein
MKRLLLCLVVAGSLALRFGTDSLDAAPPATRATPAVDFNRDVVPILSNNCFKCHGPDSSERKAKLRLDVAEIATKPAESGETAIVPGKPDKSELVTRIFSTDDDERMPPPKSNKHLTDAQRQVLKEWIEQGAVYKKHWAYAVPERPALPVLAGGQPQNAIDDFVLAKLREQKLRPSPEADRVTLVRRLYFDLIGLPPSPEQVAEFVNDHDPQAYEKLVDRLLASEHYGERMAMYWLDLVRYADSGGYHSDNEREVYLYRDYVIGAFNANKPFDRFTVEQLAGDLLPDASLETRIASGYNRMLQTTEEGGAQAKEYTAKYAADRVRNLSSVWLGSTMACCECHDHKFDPFKTRDFYSMEAFFADVKEAAVGRQEETPLPTAEQSEQLKQLDNELAAVRKTLDEQTPALDAAQAEWEKTAKTGTIDWTPLRPTTATAKSGATLKILDDAAILASGKVPEQETYTLVADLDRPGVAGIRLEAMPDPSLPAQGPGRASNGNFVLSEFAVTTSPKAASDKPTKIGLQHASADFSQSGYDIARAIDGKPGTGWAILPETGKPHVAIFETKSPIRAEKESKLTVTLDFNYGSAHSIGRLRISTTTHKPPLGAHSGLPAEVARILDIAPAQRTPEQRKTLSAYFRTIAPELKAERAKVAELDRKKSALEKTFPKTLITTAVDPRTVRILARGNWLDDSGEIVSPAVPTFLLPLEIKDRRPNRLDLARWLVDRKNPLAARVFVNRLWMLMFGQGIVKTTEDFGSQGAAPSHPELLDWLASEFVASGWDIKHLLKLIVMSATYRQSSIATEQQRQLDPDNRWLARQGRFRLDAELVRDNALAVSGLLSAKMGGPSVKPYQPAGYWAYLNFPTREWKNDRGENQYRRGLYTFWQRTFLQPSLKAFDAPTREECTAVRTRSNTPLQSLVLLNDPTYVEAARVFAARIVKEGGAKPEERIDWAFHHALSRAATADESRVLVDLYNKHHEQYIADTAAAKKLLGVGDAPAPAGVDAADLAAWTSVARVILNLHETITRS